MATGPQQVASGPQQVQALNSGKRSRAPIFGGLVLIAAGVVSLSLTLGLVPTPNGGVVGAALAVAGLAVLASYPALHTHWWTLIAGPTLLAFAAAILLPGDWGGAMFLGLIGIGFLLVAVTGLQRWWAVIPAGTLLTLALIVPLAKVVGDPMTGAVLFFGLAATFGVLAVIPVHGHHMRWPLYPAIGCLLFGLLVATSGGASQIVWPLVLVAAGAFLLIRAVTRPAGPPAPGA